MNEAIRFSRGELTATVYNSDCLDVVPILSGIDAVVTDPQYQLANGKKANSMNASAKRGANYLKGVVTIPKDWGQMHGDDKPYNPKPWIGYEKVILWGAIHYSNLLPNSTAWLIWDKRENVSSDDNADCEMAWTNLKGPARMHRQLWKGICRRGEENIAIQGDKLHPFQKPVSLMIWCLDVAKVARGETVLDPYMGSASTGIACLRTGRNFIGIEKDPKHFKTACDRLQREVNQGVLL